MLENNNNRTSVNHDRLSQTDAIKKVTRGMPCWNTFCLLIGGLEQEKVPIPKLNSKIIIFFYLVNTFII